MNKPGSLYNNGFWNDFPEESKVLLTTSYANGLFNGNLHVLESFQNKSYVLYFTEEGLGKEGLSPVITVFKSLDSGLDIVDIPLIEEVSDGFYKFVYSPTVGILVIVDGGDELDVVERWKSFKIEPDNNFITGNTGLL